jgi:hypothetical protein
VIDRAIKDRFTEIEMELLTAEEEFNLLTKLFPEVDEYYIKALAETADYTRKATQSDDGTLSEIISTRVTVETAGLLYDGFSLMEAAEISILPFFDKDGGPDSERTRVRQFLQKFIKDENSEELFGSVEKEKEEEIPVF